MGIQFFLAFLPTRTRWKIVGGSKVCKDVCLDLRNFRNMLGSIREEIDNLLANIEVKLNCVGFEGNMGLERVEGVEMKPNNAEKTPLISVDVEASLLRPLGLPKPRVVGRAVST
jgi:hypothetical protein